jgi:hypothetical protein
MGQIYIYSTKGEENPRNSGESRARVGIDASPCKYKSEFLTASFWIIKIWKTYRALEFA